MNAQVTELIQATGGPEPMVTDPAEWLGDRGRATLVALRQQHDDARASFNAVTERVEQQRGVVLRIERDLRRLKAPRGDSGFALRDDDPRVAEQRGKLASARTELQRLVALEGERGDRRQRLGRLVSACEKHIEVAAQRAFGSSLHRQDRVLPEVAPVTPRLERGESHRDGIARLRGRVAELQQQAREVETAWPPVETQKAEMRKYVHALAGSVKVDPMTGKPIPPMRRVEAQVFTLGTVANPPVREPAAKTPPSRHESRPMLAAVQHVNNAAAAEAPARAVDLHALGAHDGFAAFEIVDSEALAYSMDEANAIAAYDHVIETDAKAYTGMRFTEEQREPRRVEVARAMLDLEREEVALIAMAAEQGVVISHRPDVSAVALLGLA